MLLAAVDALASVGDLQRRELPPAPEVPAGAPRGVDPGCLALTLF